MSDTDQTPAHATGPSQTSNPAPQTMRIAQAPAPPPQVVYVQQQESFTGKAVLTLVLYFSIYLPGLITNLVFWLEAHNLRSQTGRTPAGYGCLVAMLVIQAVGIVLGLGLSMLIFFTTIAPTL
ncbi:MAG: hypothetical protein HC828_03950 [Blastochloris sp.]|nr:hypothetical protein [Blastochloris sp.]